MTSLGRQDIHHSKPGGSILAARSRPQMIRVRSHASEYGRLIRVFAGWPWTPQRWISLTAILMALAIGTWLTIIQVGSGDYGQWLMVSRAYLGKDVPDYRDISSVPPLAPLMLAVLTFVTDSPLAGLQVFKGLLGAAFVLTVYVTGSSIYRSRPAGLLAAVFAFLVTDRILELFAFGGLPQIMSMIFMIGAAGAIARAARGSAPSWKWWSLSAVLVLGATTSHVGTGIITVFSSGVMVTGVLVVNRHWTWRQRMVVAAPFALVGLAILAYYLPVLLPANASYASNPASSQYRGPDRIWAAFSLYLPNWLVLGIGTFFLADAAITSYRKRRFRIGYINLLWAGGVWLFLIVAIVADSATDYPRFTAPLLIPLAVAAGGGIATVISPGRRMLDVKYRRAGIAGIPLGVAAVIAIAIGFNTAGKHSAEADFYSLDHIDAVADVANWMQEDERSVGSIVAPTREAKWIEGFSGIPALIDIPVRFSFRDGELERSIANQTIMRSSATLVNEQYLIRFTDSKEGNDGLVPSVPWISINHGGEYVDVLQMPGSATKVFTGEGTSDLLATLGALAGDSISTDTTDQAVIVDTNWSGARRGTDVLLTRSYEMSAGSSDFYVTDKASSDIGVSGMELELWPTRNTEFASVTPVDFGALISFPVLGSSSPEILVTAEDPDVRFRMTDQGLAATSSSDTLRLKYTLVNPGISLHSLAYLTPTDVIERFDVSYVVLNDSDASVARKERLAWSGFVPLYAAGPYTVLGIGSPVTTDSPNLPGDELTTVPGGDAPSIDSQPAVLPTSTPGKLASPDEPTTETPTALPTAITTLVPTSTATPTPSPTPVPPPSEIVDVALWLSERPDLLSSSILATSGRDKEWIETLTSARTFSLADNMSDLEGEERSDAVIADSLLRSATYLFNQNLNLEFVDSKSTSDGPVPRQLWASSNFGPLLRLLPTESKVLDQKGAVLATLNALVPVEVLTERTETGVSITTLWEGERQGGTVVYSRTVTLENGEPYFELTDVVTGTAPVGGLDISIRPPTGIDFNSVEIHPDDVGIEVIGTAESPQRFSLKVPDGFDIEHRERAVGIVSTNLTNVTLRISTDAPVLPADVSELLVPIELIDKYSIETVLLRRDEAFPAREKRMNAIGFVVSAEFGQIVVMTKEVK